MQVCGSPYVDDVPTSSRHSSITFFRVGVVLGINDLVCFLFFGIYSPEISQSIVVRLRNRSEFQNCGGVYRMDDDRCLAICERWLTSQGSVTGKDAMVSRSLESVKASENGYCMFGSWKGIIPQSGWKFHRCAVYTLQRGTF